MSSSLEAKVEAMHQVRGHTAPRVTSEHIDSVIIHEDYHVFPGTTLTVCALTLRNGFHVVGESACASPENFDFVMGQQIAREHAREKIWALEGYLLRQLICVNDERESLLRSDEPEAEEEALMDSHDGEGTEPTKLHAVEPTDSVVERPKDESSSEASPEAEEEELAEEDDDSADEDEDDEPEDVAEEASEEDLEDDEAPAEDASEDASEDDAAEDEAQAPAEPEKAIAG